MNSIQHIPEGVYAIADLLEQIERVNEMIAIHQDDNFMVKQYMEKRAEFILKLQTFLTQYNLTVSAA